VTPEQKARQQIDQQLTQCSWLVQDYADMDITASRGVAVRNRLLGSVVLTQVQSLTDPGSI
jgi:hypothetical protein